MILSKKPYKNSRIIFPREKNHMHFYFIKMQFSHKCLPKIVQSRPKSHKIGLLIYYYWSSYARPITARPNPHVQYTRMSWISPPLPFPLRGSKTLAFLFPGRRRRWPWTRACWATWTTSPRRTRCAWRPWSTSSRSATGLVHTNASLIFTGFLGASVLVRFRLGNGEVHS